MLKKYRIHIGVALVLAVITGFFINHYSDPYQSVFLDIDKRELYDKREYKELQLPNKLNVLLISDPEANRSSAAMNVMVGSMADPAGHSGLTHFLEHIVIQGKTRNYPEVRSLQDYLSKNGGYYNAVTYPDYTLYSVSIDHDEYENALDRFAEKFTQLSFDPKFVESEKKIIESEHKQNFNKDSRRIRQVIKSTAKKGHAYGGFSTGNFKTIKDVTPKMVHDHFYKYYSANQMYLVLYGKNDLKTQEKLVREKFATVHNNDRARLTYEPNVFPKENLPQLLYIKPLKDFKELQLLFEVPRFYDYVITSPYGFIKHYMTRADEGSLYDVLKEKGLINDMYYSPNWLDYTGFIKVSFNLTDKGVEALDDITQMFFSYVDFLKTQGLPKEFFLEKKKMAEASYVFRDPRDGASAAEYYADRMAYWPALKVDKMVQLYNKYSNEDYLLFLNKLNPANMTTVFLHPDVKTDQKEKYYQTPYAIKSYTKEQIEKIAAVDPQLKFLGFKPNPYLPDDLAQLNNDKNKIPYKLIDDDRGIFWFMQDKAINKPKAKIELKILTDKVNETPLSYVLTALYLSTKGKELERWGDAISNAGLYYKLGNENRGLYIYGSGYSDKLIDLMKDVITEIRKPLTDKKKFEKIKKEYQRSLRNYDYNVSYSQAGYQLNNILSFSSYHLDQILPVIDDVQFEDVNEFAKTLFDELGIEGTAYGNLDPKKVVQVVDHLYKVNQAKVLPKERRFENKEVRIPKGKSYAYVRQTNASNHSWKSVFQLGPRTYKLNALVSMGRAYFKDKFYKEMRTNRQLGYVVGSHSVFFRDFLGISFLIQSATNDSVNLSNQALSWIKSSLPQMAEMTDEELLSMQNTVVKKMETERRTMSSWYNYVYHGGIDLKGDFDYREKIKAAAKAITREELVQFLQESLDPEKASSLSVYIAPKKASFPKPKETVIENIAAFKKGQETY